MSKVTRPRLARGTKLVKEHLIGTLTPVANAMSNATLDASNLAYPSGVCRLNIHIPRMDSTYWAEQPETADFCIPFTMPPLQEFFQTSGQTNPNTPVMILDEFQLAFDQRAEPAGISDASGNLTDVGMVDYLDVTRLNISIALVEKPQQIFNANVGLTPDNEVFSAQIPAVAFAGTTARVNPFVISDLGKTLSPYKSYLLMIRCPELHIDGDPPLLDRWDSTVAGVIAAGDSFSLLIGPRVYTYVAVLGDTPATVANQIATLAANDPDYDVGSSMGIVTSTTRFPSPPLDIIDSVEGAPAATFITVHTTTGQLGVTQLCLPSLTASLKILHPLVTRDQGSSIQNIPPPFGTKVGPTVPVPNPTTGSVISAIGTNGVQSAIGAVDRFVQDKLEGGYTWDGGMPPFEEILSDSTMDIIMVPMWQNCPSEHNVLTAGTMVDPDTNDSNIPYNIVLPFTEPTCDRRLIPIAFPFAVHHVIAIANYAMPGSPSTNGLVPTSTTFTTKIGVGLASICRSDLVAYQQVAYQEWRPDTKDVGQVLIDKVKARAGGTNTSFPYDYELFSIPLVGTGGVGYFPQGKPVYCAMATTFNQQRSNIGGAPSATHGQEQYLEVRWWMRDTVGLASVSNGGAAADDRVVYAGNGGNWVQIVGKKTAVQAAGDLPR